MLSYNKLIALWGLALSSENPLCSSKTGSQTSKRRNEEKEGSRRKKSASHGRGKQTSSKSLCPQSFYP